MTVVNSSLQVIFDSFVKPGNDVVDYNTRWDAKLICEFVSVERTVICCKS